MKAKLIVQQSPVTSEINICFLTDPTVRVEDCLVTSDMWQPLKWTTVDVEVTAQEERLLNLLENKEFRAMTNSEPENSLEVALHHQHGLLNAVKTAMKPL